MMILSQCLHARSASRHEDLQLESGKLAPSETRAKKTDVFGPILGSTPIQNIWNRRYYPHFSRQSEISISQIYHLPISSPPTTSAMKSSFPSSPSSSPVATVEEDAVISDGANIWRGHCGGDVSREGHDDAREGHGGACRRGGTKGNSVTFSPQRWRNRQAALSQPRLCIANWAQVLGCFSGASIWSPTVWSRSSSFRREARS